MPAGPLHIVSETNIEWRTKAVELLPTRVHVAFYEHIPTHPAAMADMPLWFTRDQVVLMKKTFTHHASEEEYKGMLARFAVDEDKESRKERRQRLKRLGKQGVGNRRASEFNDGV